MKLKMAKNSIFAILLRQPWWVSLAVVAVFVVLATALLPTPYVPFGVMGAFPFLVIAVMAAWRQRGQLPPARVAQLLDEAAQLNWRDFSARLTQGLSRQGYTVQVLEGAGADLLLTRAAQTTVVSCKRWKAASHGVDVVRALLVAQASHSAQHALYISLGPVSDAARRQAETDGVQLVNGAALAPLLAEK
jgi:restriction system protein